MPFGLSDQMLQQAGGQWMDTLVAALGKNWGITNPDELYQVRQYLRQNPGLIDQMRKYAGNSSDVSKWVEAYNQMYWNDPQKPFKDFLAAGNAEGQKAYGPPDEDVMQANAEKARLTQFYNEMLKGFDINNPEHQRIMQAVGGQAGTAMAGRGLRGGMADRTIARAMADAGLGISQSMRQLGLQALSGSLGDSRNLIAYKDRMAAGAANEAYQNQLANWETQRGQGQLIGGLIGALPGMAASAIPVVGGFIGPGLMAAGSGIGQSIGGGMAGGPPSAPVYKSKYDKGGY